MEKEQILQQIINKSQTIGRWYHYLDNIDWDSPKVLQAQKNIKLIQQRRQKLIDMFMKG